MFLDELKPFILSGLFLKFDLSEDILINNIINYYKDSHKPEQIEKIIVNLNLKNCPKEVILDLIQFSEVNYLSSALLYLHTEVEDTPLDAQEDQSCTHVILSLLNLFR